MQLSHVSLPFWYKKNDSGAHYFIYTSQSTQSQEHHNCKYYNTQHILCLSVLMEGSSIGLRIHDRGSTDKAVHAYPRSIRFVQQTTTTEQSKALDLRRRKLLLTKIDNFTCYITFYCVNLLQN